MFTEEYLIVKSSIVSSFQNFMTVAETLHCMKNKVSVYTP